MKKIKAFGFSVLFSVASQGFAQEANTDVDQEEEVEQIEVLGQKPLGLLRQEYHQFQDEFFDLYNQYADRELQVECKPTRLHMNSKVKVRKCEPVFYSIVVGEERQKQNQLSAVIETADVLANPRSNARTLAAAKKKRREMAELMANLINSNPELAQKYANMMASKEKFEAAK